MTLNEEVWKELRGGYKIVYDVSVPLRQLENTTSRSEITKIIDELWNQLHHQGDVGLASYLAVPQIIRIAKDKGLFDWRIFGLCTVIEQQRHLGQNPLLPADYKDYYETGLKELRQFVVLNLNTKLDEVTMRAALSTLATCNGQFKLGKAILDLSSDVLEEFLYGPKF